MRMKFGHHQQGKSDTKRQSSWERQLETRIQRPPKDRVRKYKQPIHIVEYEGEHFLFRKSAGEVKFVIKQKGFHKRFPCKGNMVCKKMYRTDGVEYNIIFEEDKYNYVLTVFKAFVFMADSI